ncbi:hypothetical protein DFH28DRAFT_986489 [Melampsora americana]|nr:hypothetical protein DFH28DRAFT_986489 [Melampsora americana]
MFNESNKRELTIEERRADNDAKRLKHDEERIKREEAQEQKKLQQAELRIASEISWQREKFQLERLERSEDKHIAQINMWLKEGKSVADVQLLLEMCGLAQPKAVQ